MPTPKLLWGEDGLAAVDTIVVVLDAADVERAHSDADAADSALDDGTREIVMTALRRLCAADASALRSIAAAVVLPLPREAGESSAATEARKRTPVLVRAVVASAGPLDGDDDYQDPRGLAEAAAAAAAKARAAGARHLCFAPHLSGNPLIADVLAATPTWRALEAMVLGMLQALYVPLQAREAAEAKDTGDAAASAGAGSSSRRPPASLEPIESIWLGVSPALGDVCRRVSAMEFGRRLARDVGGGDPERMTPANCAAYIQGVLEGAEEAGFPSARGVKVTVEGSSDVRAKYPLAFAVGRASMHVEHHRPVVVTLEYTSPAGEESGVDGASEPVRHVLLAGKGIVYDTGGADVKFGGVMAGMKRDKCGAAAVAGFVATVAALGGSPGLRVIGKLGFVRNSIGSDSYVADEIITSHGGRRVLVVNTDAEGRMVLADLLSHLREDAVAHAKPGVDIQLHSVATLTGHAAIAFGPYAALLDNGPARRHGTSLALQAAGAAYGDACEVSSIRREDYAFVAAKTADYDVKQCNNLPSSRTARGHQFPAAFLVRASGLEDHGLGSDVPLRYTHVDIAGAADTGAVGVGAETGRPVVALTAYHLLGGSRGAKVVMGVGAS